LEEVSWLPNTVAGYRLPVDRVGSAYPTDVLLLGYGVMYPIQATGSFSSDREASNVGPQPATGNGQPVTLRYTQSVQRHRQPATGNRQPATGNR
jgi:hypothetical protein